MTFAQDLDPFLAGKVLEYVLKEDTVATLGREGERTRQVQPIVRGGERESVGVDPVRLVRWPDARSLG